MVSMIGQFLGVFGSDVSAPETFAGVLPWIAVVGISAGLLLWCFNAIKYWVAAVAGTGRGLL